METIMNALIFICAVFYNGDQVSAPFVSSDYKATQAQFRSVVDEARRTPGFTFDGIAELRCLGYKKADVDAYLNQ
jgi:hypothetical protein